MPEFFSSPGGVAAEAFNNAYGAPAFSGNGLVVGNHATSISIVSSDGTRTIAHHTDGAIGGGRIDKTFAFASESVQDDDRWLRSLWRLRRLAYRPLMITLVPGFPAI
jgi:hypothetical protein